VVQSLVDTATQREAVRVAVARQPATNRVGLLVKVPLGYRLDSGLMLRIDERPSGNIDAVPFTRCMPDGCYAERPLTTAELGLLSAARKIEVAILALDGSPVLVNLAMDGLARNLQALQAAR
jgi:invasion protein IalB